MPDKDEPKKVTPPREPKVMPTAMKTHENMEKTPTVDLKKRRL